MKRVLIPILTFIGLKAFSCVCNMHPTEYYVDKVETIFTGRIIQILEFVDTSGFYYAYQKKTPYKHYGYRAKVLVVKKLKTGALLSDTLEFTSDFSNCDPIYKLDESYLFFADKMSDIKYKMSHCTPWTELRYARKDIKRIRKKLAA